MQNEDRPTVSLTPGQHEALSIEIECIQQQYALLPHPVQQQFLSLQCWQFENDCGFMPAMKTLVALMHEMSVTSSETRQLQQQLEHLKKLYDFLHSIAQAPCLP